MPGLRLFTRPDIQAGLRSEEAMGLAGRADNYFHSVAARLKALEHEISLGREGMAAVERHRPNLDEIHHEALKGRKQVNRLFISVVKSSADHDTLCLNQVRRLLQALVVTIDKLFASLEKSALPKERDVRRLTASHLSRLFAEKETMEGHHKAGTSMTEPSTPALPPAAEVDESVIAQALPSNRSENSVAALAQLADSAALGLAPVGLGIEDYTSPMSGASTPTAARGHGSGRSSRQPSRQTSALPTPTKEISEAAAMSSSPERAATIKKPVESTAPEAGAEESDGNSSPTARLRPISRAKQSGKPGGASEPRAKTWNNAPPAVTDSSCTEAGDVTDSSALVSSLISRFDPKSRVRSPVGTRQDKASAQQQQSSSSSSSSQLRRPQRVMSDTGARNPPSRPTSPGQSASQRPSRVNLRALHSSSASTVPTLERVPSGSRRTNSSTRGPPSSYRPPVVRPTPTYANRASESESDATSGLNRRQLGMTSTLQGTRPRPPLSRRASAKSDSGNESQQAQQQQRTLRRRVASPGPANSAPRTPLYGPSRVPMPTGQHAGKSRVSTIARHFDRINREAEREREKQRRAMALRARRALPISASTARVAQYSSVTAAVESDESSDEDDDNDDGEDDEEGGERSDDGGEADSEPEEAADGTESTSPESRLNDKGAAGGSHTKEESEVTIKGETTPPATSTLKASEAPVDPTSLPVAVADKKVAELSGKLREPPPPPSTPHMADSLATEKGSLLKTISSLWASRPGASLPLLEYPLTGEQHLFADSPLLLREDEPSSTIAFTLVSTQYQERLRSLREASSATATTSSTTTADAAQVEASLRRQEGVHLRFDFESGASRFHCRILFAEQFDALRRCCGCQRTLISSLARCVKWDSSGGKSGMTFLKTRDDRLVLKQLSASELTSFSTFAPHYFAHMAECLMHGKPTTLAKIFGLYRISLRNQATGRSYKLDVLVMENLFYGRKCSRIFDLKGSMRNRYVKETGSAGEVLLDENLVEISLQKPLYIRESSKVLIRQALRHDSDFLAAMNIMDYSVIVGLDTEDDENRELVVGIIDFLRSYTWDKRVETFVKEQSSLLVAAGKGELPTVITPKQYANRFLSFLDGILLLSPDSWYKDEERGGMMGSADPAEKMAEKQQDKDKEKQRDE